jgi:hypothetical protein
MNALLSVLQPSPEARTIHRRLGHVLECQRFELLQAKANIWEPGERPSRAQSTRPKPPPIASRRGRASHDKLHCAHRRGADDDARTSWPQLA